jgi:hypothetical protein
MAIHHEVSELMENVKADKKAKDPSQDPAFSLDQIVKSVEQLKRDTDYIFKNPPDAKMRNEGRK